MRIAVSGVLALGLLTAACGSNETQRAATGSLTGIGVGAAVGGPVGAVVGGVVGAAGGSLMPEGADTIAENAIRKEHTAANSSLRQAGLERPAAAPANETPSQIDRVKQAQTELKREGLYHAKIDGIVGPKTRHALAEFQKREGLQQTARLDDQTVQRLAAAEGGPATAQNNGNPTEASGTSTPGTALSPSQLRQRLQQQGYNNITDLNRNSDNSWSAQAQRGDQTLALRVDAQTGRVLSEHGLASGSPMRSGASTGNDNGNGAAGNANGAANPPATDNGTNNAGPVTPQPTNH